MSYFEKVSGTCRQDEDFFGEKFRYNKSDDIVLLFSEENKLAYCYKREDLKRLIKFGYKMDNTYFSYLILPHTNQYIVNPETILNSEKHTFKLNITDRSLYRRNYPEILYDVEAIILPEFQIFENPPEIGVEIKEASQSEFKPSEQYLENERKMRELRERRRNEGKEIVIAEPEQKVIRETRRQGRELTTDRDMINTFLRNKQKFEKYLDYFNRKVGYYERNLENILYSGESKYNALRTFSLEQARSVENQYWILEEPNHITWYRNGVKNREDDLPAEIYTDNYGFKLLWFINGNLERIDNRPLEFNSDGYMIFSQSEIMPQKIDTVDYIMSWDTYDVYFFREEVIFEGIDVMGKIKTRNREIFIPVVN